MVILLSVMSTTLNKVKYLRLQLYVSSFDEKIYILIFKMNDLIRYIIKHLSSHVMVYQIDL